MAAGSIASGITDPVKRSLKSTDRESVGGIALGRDCVTEMCITGKQGPRFRSWPTEALAWCWATSPEWCLFLPVLNNKVWQEAQPRVWKAQFQRFQGFQGHRIIDSMIPSFLPAFTHSIFIHCRGRPRKASTFTRSFNTYVGGISGHRTWKTKYRHNVFQAPL